MSSAQLESLGYRVEGQQILGTNQAQTLRVDPQSGAIQIHNEAVYGPRQLWDVELDRALPGRISIDPTLASRIRFPGAPEIVYIIRNGDEILKVGKTTSEQAASRFGVYRRAGERLELNLRIEVIPVHARTGQTVESIESGLRQHFADHPMPWDNTGRRLGRGGPGTPWDSFNRGTWRGWGFDPQGRFVPLSEGAASPGVRPEIPSRADLMELLTTHEGSVMAAAGAARDGGMSTSTLYRWLRLYELDPAMFRN